MAETDQPAAMPIGLDNFQLHVGQWAAETFPGGTIHSAARHLFREAAELCFATNDPGDDREYGCFAGMVMDLAREHQKARARAKSPSDVPQEAADILLLLLHLAHKAGFSLQAVAHGKHEENKARQWGEVDHAGVVSHVEPERGS